MWLVHIRGLQDATAGKCYGIRPLSDQAGNTAMGEKRIALVTGSAGVLGLAAVRGLLEDRIKVIMADIDGTKLFRSSADIDGDTHPVVFDVSDAQQVFEAVSAIKEEIGDIDILVNNAGILSTNKSSATTPEEWHRVLRVNLDGAFYLSKEVIPGMKKKGWGRIINVCSLAAKSGGITAGTAYSTSKGALMSLTFSLAAETAAFGITVNGIAPAYVKTPMVMEQLTEKQRRDLLKMIPVGRFCEPEEFAYVVRFLANPL